MPANAPLRIQSDTIRGKVTQSEATRTETGDRILTALVRPTENAADRLGLAASSDLVQDDRFQESHFAFRGDGARQQSIDAMPDPLRTKLRVLTYNIHKAIGGLDRKYRPERIIETIDHYGPDIVLLQEVDDGVRRSRFDRQVDLLGDALDFKHRAFQPNVPLKAGHYGNAILSRFSMAESVNIDLTIPLKKRRRALIAEFHITIGHHHRKLMICNTHLGLAGLERKVQMRKVLGHDVIKHLHFNTPLIIAGDLNDVWSSLAKTMVPEKFLSASKHIRTFPAFRPLRSLDAIYYRGDLQLESCFVGHTKLARRASDHLPLIADFEICTHDQCQ